MNRFTPKEMASNDLSAAEAQWREQYAAMRAALADLRLPSAGKQPMVNGDLDDSDFGGYSSGTSGQGHDVWDFISDDEEDEDSSDYVEPDSLGWFSNKCADIAAKNGMSPDVFQTQILSALSSGLSDEEVQMQLTDLVGFDDLDFIIDVLAQKDAILAGLASQGQKQAEPTGRRLLTKAQREDALRQQDFEHKTASLAPTQEREIHYPHVYKSYSAGNTLSYQGKKYALPTGTERLQFEKYEEYSIPAGRKGTLGPGQKLVKISDLDGLCQTTFKGYKTLNRMQSLVYPVAYKTNENMLICAPTGAVSLYIVFQYCDQTLTTKG